MEAKIFLLERLLDELVTKYRIEWDENRWESEDIEEFGLNEFLGGKAEAYEDCLLLVRTLMGSVH